MTRYLLDVNVFFALLWPRHEHHAIAQAWFGRAGRDTWATNPLTQLGVLRLLTNPAVGRGSVNAITALEALEQATRHPGHEFWPLEGPLPALLRGVAGRVQGHRQWTDAILLAQAAGRGGALVTFDAGVRELASRDLAGHVHVLKAR